MSGLRKRRTAPQKSRTPAVWPASRRRDGYSRTRGPAATPAPSGWGRDRPRTPRNPPPPPQALPSRIAARPPRCVTLTTPSARDRTPVPRVLRWLGCRTVQRRHRPHRRLPGAPILRRRGTGLKVSLHGLSADAERLRRTLTPLPRRRFGSEPGNVLERSQTVVTDMVQLLEHDLASISRDRNTDIPASVADSVYVIDRDAGPLRGGWKPGANYDPRHTASRLPPPLGAEAATVWESAFGLRGQTVDRPRSRQDRRRGLRSWAGSRDLFVALVQPDDCLVVVGRRHSRVL
jgi:hypothetical protein